MGTPAGPCAVAPKSRWKRRVAAVVLPAILVAAIAAAWYAGGGRYKWCPPYREALRQVAGHPQVVERLGQPVRDASWLPSGSLTSGERPQANLMFRVAGPRGKADVHVQARQVAGQWGGTISVSFGPGERVQLELGEAGQNEAPRFEASGQAAGTAAIAAPSPPAPAGQAAPEPSGEIRIEIPP